MATRKGAKVESENMGKRVRTIGTRLWNQKTTRKKRKERVGEIFMGKFDFKTGAAVLVGAVTLAALPAKADFIVGLGIGNSGISSYPGPYGTVDVHLTDSTHATITFTSITKDGYIYLFGGQGAVGVNVNATSWTLGSLSAANHGTGFINHGNRPSDPLLSNGGAGHEDGFGSFNQTINSFDGFTHSSDTISFTLTDKSGTWANANRVLALNADGHIAAAHIFVTASPANAANGALATGYAAAPEPTTMIAGVLLLLPFGASTLRVLCKNKTT